MDATMIKETTAAASALATIIKPVVDTFVTPKLKEIKKNKDFQKALHGYELDTHFFKYTQITYDNNSYISTFFDSRLKLRDIYIPLTIRRDNDNEGASHYIIDKYDAAFFSKHKKITILDNAGMGKSTVLKYLYLSIIDQNKGYPILVNLRRLSKTNTILNEIEKELELIDRAFNREVLQYFLNQGDFVFLFDGFDEIADDVKTDVIDGLNDFINKANKNSFILTSRPDQNVNAFPFERFKILDLTFEQNKKLFMNYDKSAGKEIANSLINELEENDNYEKFESFLQNPLLSTMLLNSYQYNRTISEKKHSFYYDVFDALFRKHDNYKPGFKRSFRTRIGKEGVESLLKKFSFCTLRENKTEYTSIEFEKILKDLREQNTDWNFEVDDIIHDLTVSTSLFVRDGIYFKWCHKSMQEYFFAKHIYEDGNENKNQYLIKICETKNVGKYLNMLSIYYDMDKANFESVIVLPFLKAYVNYVKDRKKEFDTDVFWLSLSYSNNVWIAYGYDVPSLKKENVFDEDLISIIENTAASLKLSDSHSWGATLSRVGPQFFFAVIRDYCANYNKLVTSLLHEKAGYLFTQYEYEDELVLSKVSKEINFELMNLTNDFIINTERIDNIGLLKVHMLPFLSSDFSVLSFHDCAEYLSRIEKDVPRQNDEIPF